MSFKYIEKTNEFHNPSGRNLPKPYVHKLKSDFDRPLFDKKSNQSLPKPYVHKLKADFDRPFSDNKSSRSLPNPYVHKAKCQNRQNKENVFDGSEIKSDPGEQPMQAPKNAKTLRT